MHVVTSRRCKGLLGARRPFRQVPRSPGLFAATRVKELAVATKLFAAIRRGAYKTAANVSLRHSIKINLADRAVPT